MDFYKLYHQVELLGKKIEEMNELKNYILSFQNSQIDIMEGWLPRLVVMKFLGYGNTQMTAVARKYDFIATKIGSRIFYQKRSIIKALKTNLINK
jgi:hypothetical protein